MSFTVLKNDIFFIRLKSSDQTKVNHVVVLSLFITILGTKLKVKTRATTLTKIAFPQISYNLKEKL